MTYSHSSYRQRLFGQGIAFPEGGLWHVWLNPQFLLTACFNGYKPVFLGIMITGIIYKRSLCKTAGCLPVKIYIDFT